MHINYCVPQRQWVGGGTLSEVHQSVKKLLLKSRDDLERLERLEYSTVVVAVIVNTDSELSFVVKKDITQNQSLCVEMDHLWGFVAAKPQRYLWKSWCLNHNVNA
ncbi:Membrin-11, partial [Mucuna pruriens]